MLHFFACIYFSNNCRFLAVPFSPLRQIDIRVRSDLLSTVPLFSVGELLVPMNASAFNFKADGAIDPISSEKPTLMESPRVSTDTKDSAIVRHNASNLGPLIDCFRIDRPNGSCVLIHQGYAFHRNRNNGHRITWLCGRKTSYNCPAKINEIDNIFYATYIVHNTGCEQLQSKKKRLMVMDWTGHRFSGKTEDNSTVSVADDITRFSPQLPVSDTAGFSTQIPVPYTTDCSPLFCGPITDYYLNVKPNGGCILIRDGYAFHRIRCSGGKTTWLCGRKNTYKCPARITEVDNLYYLNVAEHSDGCQQLQRKRFSRSHPVN